MAQAKHGDTVRVHYTGKLEDGTVFDTSTKRRPLEFTIGEGRIIRGFEQAVVGMKPGESKTTKVPVNNAYGPHREDLVLVVNRRKFPVHLKLELGRQLQVTQANGRTRRVKVVDVSESSVTLDANHPLAGEDLTFDIQLVEVV
jgi:peptidylprolyl isomerase